jgi:hypothetical protein
MRILSQSLPFFRAKRELLGLDGVKRCARTLNSLVHFCLFPQSIPVHVGDLKHSPGEGVSRFWSILFFCLSNSRVNPDGSSRLIRQQWAQAEVEMFVNGNKTKSSP